MLNIFKRNRRRVSGSNAVDPLRIRDLLDDPRLQAAMQAPPSVAELAAARFDDRELLGVAA